MWKGMLFAMLWTLSLGLFAQNITVKGTVKDANNEPVIGASVVVKGDALHGTVTDVEGHYVLERVPNNATLQISYVGMKNQEVSVGGKTVINVTLAEETLNYWMKWWLWGMERAQNEI